MKTTHTLSLHDIIIILIIAIFAFCYKHKANTKTVCTVNKAAEFEMLVLKLDINVSCPHPMLPLAWFPFFQWLVQGAANRDLHAQTVTTSTPTLLVTLRER